jgi:hypothetical protein
MTTQLFVTPTLTLTPSLFIQPKNRCLILPLTKNIHILITIEPTISYLSTPRPDVGTLAISTTIEVSGPASRHVCITFSEIAVSAWARDPRL